MNKGNLNRIRINYYYLLKSGFSLDELKNLEIHEFDFYVKQYIEEQNEKREQRMRMSTSMM